MVATIARMPEEQPTTCNQRNLICFIIAVLFLGIAGGIFEATFNNFLSDTFDLEADARGLLEFPRELPGFLVALFAAALFFLPETMVAAMAAFATGLGLLGLAVWGVSWNWMLALMILWSTGNHLLMPVKSSIALDLSDITSRGKRLGQVQGVGIAATIIGCGVVWTTMKYMQVDYSLTFTVAGIAAMCAALAFVRMNLKDAHLRRPRFVLRKKYWLFYMLAFLFGARKQVFITFGPWVLVRIFNQPAFIIAQLLIVAAVIGIFFQPMLGRLIDRIGERRILVLDSICVVGVCLGYGLSHRIGNQQIALYILYACYVGDLLLFGANMARTTYLSRIAEKKEDVSPTLSLGITINHAVSMSVPALGGLLWIHYGHTTVFLAAAGVAVLMMVFSAMIPGREKGPLQPAQP